MGPSHSRECLAARAVLLRPGKLSGRITDCLLRSRPASPSLNGFHGSRAVLLADQLDRSRLQVMAHRILPSTGHEVARAARVGSKRPRQRLRLSPRPQQGQERVPDPNLQRQQRIADLVRQNSRGLGQERPQGRRMRHVPLPRGDGPLRMAERLYAFDSVFLLNRYFEVMEQAIRRHGGAVDKFLGDGIMALFGASSAPERGSRDALLAAGAMLDALEGLNAVFHTSLPEPLRMGIGIHLGPAVLGRVGGGRARSLTALGDSVNIASRLESLNKEFGSVLVASDAAVRASGLTRPAAELREISLRGRAEPLRVHVLQARPALMEAATSTRVARMSRE